jgi:hypothetical protein
MRLYQSRTDTTRWYGYSEATGWVTFQDTTGRWTRRPSTREMLRSMFAKYLSNLGSLPVTLLRRRQA